MPILRLPNGDLRDEIRTPIYDTVVIAAGESPVGTRSFFSNVQGKSKAQTNLQQNNILPQAVSYRIMGIAMDVQNYVAANVQALPIIMENSSNRLRVGEKDYWESNMLYLAGRISAFYAISGAAAPTTLAYQRFGDIAVQPLVLTGKHCVDINPLQNFFIEWVCSGLTAGEITAATPAVGSQLKFVASLKGLLRRPVQ